MIIGFTGTRRGMTDAQKKTVEESLIKLKPDAVGHGDCIGADAEFGEMARRLGIKVIVHPPVDETHRAFSHADEVLPAKTHFARNRDIVQNCNLLLGAPAEFIEQPLGGTWYTLRYAVKYGTPVEIIWPDGSR